jgi:hypothetical protein
MTLSRLAGRCSLLASPRESVVVSGSRFAVLTCTNAGVDS